MSKIINNKETFYIEKVPDQILKGLGWVQVERKAAISLAIPHYYTSTVVIPNPEPYCCPIHPEDKTEYFQLTYQNYFYIYLPAARGKSKKFSLCYDNKVVKLTAQKCLTNKAVKEWVLSWTNFEIKLVSPAGKLVLNKGEPRSRIAFVYFIINHELNSIKIGRAKNVEKRLKSLQTSSPVPLEIVKIIQVEGIEEARNMENSLHRRFSHLRMSGEWFKATPELINYLNYCQTPDLRRAASSTPKPYKSVKLSEL